MSRKTAFECFKNLNKNGIRKSLNFLGVGFADPLHPPMVKMFSIQKRYCHISNVATQRHSDQIDMNKISDLQNKILHSTVMQINGKN